MTDLDLVKAEEVRGEIVADLAQLLYVSLQDTEEVLPDLVEGRFLGALTFEVKGGGNRATVLASVWAEMLYARIQLGGEYHIEPNEKEHTND